MLVNRKNERLLIDFKAKKTVWRQNTEGETHQEWNAASRAVAFVKDDNLYVTDADGNTRQLTTDGSHDIVYGQSVHRDEFGIYKGTFWSPDGQKLAFYRMDQSMVPDYPLVDIDTRIATLQPTKYPMVGEASHKVTVGVYDLATGKTVYLKAGDPTDRYFSNVAWSPDNKLVYMIEINRDQTDMELVSYDATTGEKRATLYKEHHDKYVHPVNPITFLPWDADKFILQSEKDGYNHLYLFNTKGEQLKQITSGKWLVLELVGFNAKAKAAIIVSTESSPIQNNIYSVNIETGKRTLLDNGRGVHAAAFGEGGHRTTMLSASGRYVFDKYSEPDVPRNIDIIDTEKASRTSYFKAANPWAGYNVPEYSCGTIKAADGVTDLYYRMVKPVNFDPNKKYPTVVYVYGGPGIRNVTASWHYASRGWETYMAQKGYLLFILDNRGSSDRGRDFEQATFRHLGVEEMKDQLKGVEYLKSLAYVDTTRHRLDKRPIESGVVSNYRAPLHKLGKRGHRFARRGRMLDITIGDMRELDDLGRDGSAGMHKRIEALNDRAPRKTRGRYLDQLVVQRLGFFLSGDLRELYRCSRPDSFRLKGKLRRRYGDCSDRPE